MCVCVCVHMLMACTLKIIQTHAYVSVYMCYLQSRHISLCTSHVYVNEYICNGTSYKRISVQVLPAIETYQSLPTHTHLMYICQRIYIC